MFFAMNRFDVMPDQEAAFERIWKERESFLSDVAGFVQFALLRGDTAGDYVSHSVWESRAAFEDWTRSEAFAKGHRQGSLKGILAGPPQVSLFTAVIAETPDSRVVDPSEPEPGRTSPSL